VKLKTIYWAVSTLLRYGWPKRLVTTYVGIGDELMVTAAFWELHQRKQGRGTWFMSRYPQLWQGSGIASSVLPWNPGFYRLVERLRVPVLPIGYCGASPNPEADCPLPGHAITNLCRQLGVSGSVDLKPHFVLSPSERKSGRHFAKQIAIQSSNAGGAHVIPLKKWPMENFQQVAEALTADGWGLVQLGSKDEPYIEGALDFRGKTTLREAASVLAHSQLFIGLAGGLMHLARAVDCPSVIIYGGREEPRMAGYSANINLVALPACAPCYLHNHCPEGLICMTMVGPEKVIAAARQRLAASGPLPTESVEL